MAEVQTEEVYLLDRNSKEADRYAESCFYLKPDQGSIANVDILHRLNGQHAFLVDLVGSPLHPSIPIEGIQAVADIATGTG